MNHPFLPSQLDQLVCSRCKFDAVAHTDRATCETCQQQKPCEVYIDMLICPECIEKEKVAEAEIAATANDRVAKLENDNQAFLQSRAREIDHSVKIGTDLFNAETVAIVDLQKSIDENPEIENKIFALAESVDARYKAFAIAIFDRNTANLEDASKQRADQTFLNKLANSLRVEEREKLKLSDISYKPVVKEIKKPKAPSRKKFDKEGLRLAAAELGIPEFNLQAMVIQMNKPLEEIVTILKKSIAEGKAKSVNVK